MPVTVMTKGTVIYGFLVYRTRKETMMLCSLIITYIDPGDYGLLLPPKHTRGRKRISCLTGVIFTDRSKSTTPQGDGNKLTEVDFLYRNGSKSTTPQGDGNLS